MAENLDFQTRRHDDWINDRGRRVKPDEGGHSIAGSATPKYDKQNVSAKVPLLLPKAKEPAVSPAKVLPRS